MGWQVNLKKAKVIRKAAKRIVPPEHWPLAYEINTRTRVIRVARTCLRGCIRLLKRRVK